MKLQVTRPSEALQLTAVVLNRTFGPGLLEVLFPEANYYLDPGFEQQLFFYGAVFGD